MKSPEQNIFLQQSKNSTLDVSRYFKLFLEKKYWILLITILSAIVFVFLFNYFINSNQTYTVSAVIRFDNPKGNQRNDAVGDFASLGSEGKVAILRTRSLISTVVDSLKANFVLLNPDIEHAQFFESLKVADSKKYGKYSFVNKLNGLNIYYENSENGKKLLKTVSIESQPKIVVDLNGIKLSVDTDLIQEEKDITFSYIPKKFAIESILRHLETTLDRSKTILTLTYSNKDPGFAALTLNTLSKLFIEKLLEYKRHQTLNVMKSLEDRLNKAQEELNKSEKMVKEFKERHPYVYLTGETGQVVQNLVDAEKSLTEKKQILEDLDTIFKRKTQISDVESRNFYYQELINFLAKVNLLGAALSEQQLTNLMTERETLLSEYSTKHPIVVETEKKITALEQKIETRSKQYWKDLNKDINRTNQEVKTSKSNLYKLPTNELRLAELNRKMEVNSTIVSTIMARYNQARVTDAAIVSDAYLIDKAEAPISKKNPYGTLIAYPLGLLLGFILALLIFFLLDYFSPAIKSAKNAEEVLKLPVLASIPVIGDERELPDPSELKKRVDPKLITVDYSPSIEGEAFRMIRTKIVFEKFKEKHTLIITSLNPDEGKSLVSSNLSITFAQQKYPTVLVDCDLRRGVLHNSFGCDKTPGLSDLLKSNAILTPDSITDIVQETHIPNLFLVTSGTPIPNPSELLGSAKMKQFIDLVEKKFGMVIIDTAPIKFTPDAFVVNSYIHKILLVVRFGKTNLNRLADKTKEFGSLKDDFVGVVVNASKEISKKDHYSYSYYHY